MSDWVDKLTKKYSYCNYINLVPFPAAAPELFIGYKIVCTKKHKDINQVNCAICKYCKPNKCDCYHTNTNGEGICWGTKECEECFCEGNKLKCDFYKD